MLEKIKKNKLKTSIIIISIIVFTFGLVTTILNTKDTYAWTTDGMCYVCDVDKSIRQFILLTDLDAYPNQSCQNAGGEWDYWGHAKSEEKCKTAVRPDFGAYIYFEPQEGLFPGGSSDVDKWYACNVLAGEAYCEDKVFHPEPILGDRKFIGWGTSPYCDSTIYKNDEDIIKLYNPATFLYACYDSIKYRISFYARYGVIPNDIIVNKGDSFTLPQLNNSNTNFVFTHWEDNTGNKYYVGDPVVPTFDMIFIAVFEENNISGSGGSGNSSNNDGSSNSGGSGNSSNNDGSSNSGGSGNSSNNGGSSNSNVSYTITYDGNGGTWQGKTSWVDDNTVVIGESYRVYSNDNFFVREGYTFTGWKDQNGEDWTTHIINPFVWNENYAYDITLYAQWTANDVKLYTVTYDGNGGTWQGKTTWVDNDHRVAIGDSYKVYSNDNFFVREGYTFTGWRDQNGEDWTYHIITPFKWNNKYAYDITLYAQWEPNDAKRYTVTYDGNGGLYKGSPTYVDKDRTMTMGQAYTVYSNDDFFVREGYNFTGWKDQNGEDWTMHITRPFVWKEPYDYDITLYAQWEKINNDTDSDTDKTDEEINTNNKTGDVLIYIVWTIGIGTLGYTIYYFTKRKDSL